MNCLRKTHKVEFYPIADNFTQALLVMLVTNITSAHSSPLEWKVLAEVIWTNRVIIKETKSICKNMVNIALSHRPLTSELKRVLPLKQNECM